MAMLRIAHAISDFPTCKGTFDRFATARTLAGVRRYRIFHAVDDPAYVLLDLHFQEGSAAETFLAFLHRDVWGSAQASPALVGGPQMRMLEPVEEQHA